MSKLFYDHLILIDEITVEIESLQIDLQTKEKIRKTVDELVNYKVMTKILDLLPKNHHEEFLKEFHKFPANVRHLEFLQRRVEVDIKEELIKLGEEIKKEIRRELKASSV
jgi:hypothetical protein